MDRLPGTGDGAPGDAFTQVLGLPDGGFVVFWTGTIGGMAAPTMGHHFDATGTPLGLSFVLAGVSGVTPSVATATGIQAVTSFLRDEDTQTVLHEFTPDGAPVAVSPVEDLLDTTRGLSLASTPGDGLIVVWSNGYNGYNQVFSQRFGANLSPAGPISPVTVPPEDGGSVGDVVSTSDGGFVTGWYDEDLGNIWARQVDGHDVPKCEPFQVAYGLQTSTPPEFCTDANDDFIVAWSGTGGGAFRRYAKNAHPITPPLGAGFDLWSLACLARASIVVGFAAYPSTAIIGRAFDAESRPVGHLLIPAVLSRSATVSAARDDAAFVVAWSDCGTNPDNCDIFAQRYALAPGEDCSGDCNSDGIVTVDELVGAVNLALNDPPDYQDTCATSACPFIDTDLDCKVSITELIAAVNQALNGCDTGTTPTPTGPPNPTAISTPSPTPCAGDCNGDGVVSANEVATMTEIGLGVASPSQCPSADTQHDYQVTVDEILGGLNNAVFGCGSNVPPEAACPRSRPAEVGAGFVVGDLGATLSVPLTIDYGLGGVAGAQADLLFDQTIVAPQLDPQGQPVCLLDHRLRGFTLRTSLAPGRLRILLVPSFDPLPMSLPSLADGVVARCGFTITANAQYERGYPLTPDRVVVADVAGRLVESRTDGGAFDVFSGFLSVHGEATEIAAGKEDESYLVTVEGDIPSPPEVTVAALTDRCTVAASHAGPFNDFVRLSIPPASRSTSHFVVRGTTGDTGTCVLLVDASGGYAGNAAYLSIIQPAPEPSD